MKRILYPWGKQKPIFKEGMRTQKADYREIERFPLVNRPSLKEVAETILKAPQKRGTV